MKEFIPIISISLQSSMKTLIQYKAQNHGNGFGQSYMSQEDKSELRALSRHHKKQRKYYQKNRALFELDERQNPGKFPAHLFNNNNEFPQIYTQENEHRKRMRRTHADLLMLKHENNMFNASNGLNGNNAYSSDDENIVTENRNVDAILRASRDLLPRRIVFKEAEKKDAYQTSLKNMKPLNGTKDTATLFELTIDENGQGNTNGHVSDSTSEEDSSSAAQTQPANKKNARVTAKIKEEKEIENNTPLDKPSTTLYPKYKLLALMNWKAVNKVGPGFENLGNTCFMNAALQCLIYTPCLHNYLLSRKVVSSVKGMPFHALNEMTALMHEIAKCKSSVFSPKNIAYNLKGVHKDFRLGRQEDSHEFIINLIDKMESCILKNYKQKLEKRIQETNAIHQIFGGYLRSQVRSLESNYISNTYDPFVGLSLQLNHCNSVEKALAHFVAPDILDDDNKYKCPLTKKYVKATKSMSIHEAPLVLIIQLKRFNIYGKKLSKHVSYNEVLDLSPYMSDKPSRAIYHLHGVLVHSGGSCHSGHYYSYVKNSNGVWYEMNDTSRKQVSVATVLSQQAYILFYSKECSPTDILTGNGQHMSDNELTTPISTPTITHRGSRFPAIIETSTNVLPDSIHSLETNGKILPDINKNRENENNGKENNISSNKDTQLLTPLTSRSMLPPAAPNSSNILKDSSSPIEDKDQPSKSCLLTRRKHLKLQALSFMNSGVLIPSPVKTNIFARSPLPQSPLPTLRSPISKSLNSTQMQALAEMDRAINGGDANSKSPVALAVEDAKKLNGNGNASLQRIVTPGKKEETPTSASNQAKSPFNPLAFASCVSSSRYGEQVETWDNTVSTIPEAVLIKVTETNKRKRDDWDRILDAGKMKKVKRNKHVDTREEIERNNAAFQKVQNELYKRK